MKKVLVVLGQLTDQDIDWLVGVGEKHPINRAKLWLMKGGLSLISRHPVW